MKQTKKLILASTSKGRKDILKSTGVKFTVEASDYEEDMTLNLKPKDLVKKFSQGKARAVAKKHTSGIVIGADSVGVVNGKAIGKPKDEAEAKAMLKSLSGRTHSFVTSFTVIDTSDDTEVTKMTETKVTFKKLTDEEIDTYIQSGEPMSGKAAAYAAQGKGAALIKKIEGDYMGLCGLPICDLNEVLQPLGISLLA